jgi:FeS assembly SUF system regulator
MIRISKLADYSVVIMGWLAQQQKPSTIKQISDGTQIPLATVRKLTRFLTAAELCRARKGPHGGYSLARPAQQVSLLSVIEAVEGEMAVTECALQDGCDCSLMPHCDARPGWQVINLIIRNLLSGLSVADVMHENISESAVMERLVQFNAGTGQPVGLSNN